MTGTRTLDAVRSLPSRHFSIRHFEDGDQIELTKDRFGTLDLGFVVLAHSDRDQVLADYAKVRELESRLIVRPIPPGRDADHPSRLTGPPRGNSSSSSSGRGSRPREGTEMTGKTEGRSRDARLALVAAAITVLLWASAFVVIRSAGSHFSAGPLALGRLVVGLLALGVTSLIRRQGWPPRAAWRGIIIAGVLWFGVYFVTLNWGEQKVDAGTASMLVNVGPILIALLGGWLLKDRLPPRVFAGLIISFAGAAVVGVSMSGRGAASILGVLLCLAAAVAYACGVVAQKPALRHASALQVTTFACMVGAIVCLPFVGQLISQVGKAPLSANLGIVYLGVFPTALAFTTWAYALSTTTAAKMGATTYLVPVVTVLLAWAFLDQVPAWLSLAGGAACLVGVAVTRSKRRVSLRPASAANGYQEGRQ